MVTEAWGLPLGAEKCVIERDKVLDIIDEIKAQFPQELAEAKRLVSARDEFISSAKREAEAMRKSAEEQMCIRDRFQPWRVSALQNVRHGGQYAVSENIIRHFAGYEIHSRR